MSGSRAIYEEVILDHNRKPRNYHALPAPVRKAEGFNPLCGDHFTVYLKVEGGRIADAGFEGAGCAISKASASMMTDAIKGKTVDEAQAMFNHFHHMLTDDMDTPIDEAKLGKLAAFSGVRAYPVRIKCATLAWHALHAALEGKDEPVSTE